MSTSDDTGPGGERLSKRMAALGLASRREADEWIAAGWVRVDGKPAVLGLRVGPDARIDIDPRARREQAQRMTVLLHKPVGYEAGLGDGHGPQGSRSRGAPPAMQLLTPAAHAGDDASGIRVLQKHFANLKALVPLPTEASGLVVFTQDWRVQRKLEEDIATMEHELLVDVAGEVSPDALTPILRALKDERRPLPAAKVSVNSSTPEGSRLRFAIKGAHPGLAAHLCALAGLDIRAMRRTRLGRVALSDLPVGQWRYLAGHERF